MSATTDNTATPAVVVVDAPTPEVKVRTVLFIAVRTLAPSLSETGTVTATRTLLAISR